ncbi:MAG: hypothetical protein KDC35_00755 [Acidobacteria bacterium]|nr:hypothetical protein [Acidobacteriota bacterium]
MKSNLRLTSNDSELDVRDLLIQLNPTAPNIERGELIGVHHEWEEGHYFRPYYVVDCLNTAEGRFISICVQRCFTTEGHKPGLSSGRLCDLAKGQSIALSGPYPSPFRIPSDPTCDIIMIGIGTGMAAFRTLLSGVFSADTPWAGSISLFYGARSGLEVLFFNGERDDLSPYLDEPNFSTFIATRKDDHMHDGEPVSDQLVRNRSLVLDLIRKPKTHIFVAGNHTLAFYLDRSFVAIAGGKEQWVSIHNQMLSEGRWQETLY